MLTRRNQHNRTTAGRQDVKTTTRSTISCSRARVLLERAVPLPAVRIQDTLCHRQGRYTGLSDASK